MVEATSGRGSMNTIGTDVKTPCTGVCTLDPVSGLCIGCGRSVAEIAGWMGFDRKERAAIMMRLPTRLAGMTSANTNPTMA
jgi:uncharacterized protein